MGEKGEDKERSIYIYVHRNLDSGMWLIRGLKVGKSAQCLRTYHWRCFALRDTNCEVVGSTLWVIGGWDSVDNAYTNVVRCLDTRNPSEGWKTCFTFAIGCCRALSAVSGCMSLEVIMKFTLPTPTLFHGLWSLI